MEQCLLAEASQTGNTEAFYALLQQNPYLLDDIDKIPFVDTPLHISASAGFTHFALEILTLKSSFGKKLNPDGFSPIDLALRFGHAQTVKRLVDNDPHLIGVKGKERFTALHYVAEVDDVDLLAEFLVKSPKSVEDLTIRGETAVHVAVRNRNVRALKVLLGFLQLTEKEKILNWEDENGDTVLHIAASTNNIEVVRLLVGKVNINHKNQAGLTALDIAIEHSNPAADGKQIERILGSAGGRSSSTVPKIDSLADVLSSNVSSSTRKLFKHNTQVELGNFGGLNNLSGDTRNALLVVAVLITTATYQAMLSPPGGFSSGGGSANTNTHTLSKSLAMQLPRNGAGMADIGGKELNPDGFSPLDLALRYEQTNTVKWLLDYDPHMIGVKGKERFTALHYVAEVDNVDLLAMFLDKSPKSVEDLTVRRETAVRVAVRNRNDRALKVLLGFVQLTDDERILDWEDENGDTVLHIVASTNTIEARILSFCLLLLVRQRKFWVLIF
ncbi:hypothetical protein ACH5RR_009454 [Cinchona calisaya]|uniref:PGG domain-containing protein n=1 Tax=Cinchona calisaya TaxID=153742 RepID=A0ABD3AHK0_9GENT